MAMKEVEKIQTSGFHLKRNLQYSDGSYHAIDIVEIHYHAFIYSEEFFGGYAATFPDSADILLYEVELMFLCSL